MTNHDEQLNTAVARHTDEQGRECEGCGSWIYPEEDEVNGLCVECAPEPIKGHIWVYQGDMTWKLFRGGKR